jgi:transcriptional regulator of acetoin/glycerol metabolism
VTDEVMNILMNHEYPGNIRELENLIEHAFVLCREAYIKREHLPHHLQSLGPSGADTMTLDELEHLHITRALERNDWNRGKTAKELGIDASTLWRKMKRFGIDPP